MQTQLIVNPQANRGQAQHCLPEIIRILEEAAIPISVWETEAPGQAIELARLATLAGVERVVAVGGDGTCNEVVNGLLAAVAQGRQADFGHIPIGSGNDLAYGLGLPADYRAACRRLKDGGPRLIDLGRVTVDGESRYFVNNVGLGLEAEVTLRLEEITHPLLGGFSRYLWAVIQVIFFGRWPYPMKIRYGQIDLDQPTILISIGNGVRAGGGFLITPYAKMDDGLLDLCYASSISLPKVLALLPRVLKGTHTTHPAITMATTTHLTVTAAAGIPAHSDGEILCRAGRQFEFEIAPQALRVWI